MSALEAVSVGIVGAAGRGGRLRHAFELLDAVRITAVCDIDAEGLERARHELGASDAHLDFDEMLERSELDAVIIGTPMPLHAPQAIAALERGVHVLSEVPAGVSISECRRLVQACRTSRASYMLGENVTYTRPNMIVREMVRRGEFGTAYYAEGEYVHELKGLNEVTRWRRRWQTGINGVTYGTHSLGPILQWMPGDRVISVCCAGSGHHYRDPRGDEYENEDSCVMLCRLRSGGLVKIRVDMLSDRPHSMMNFQLQGTDGCYESRRAPAERDRIWLRSRSPDANTWLDLAEVAESFLPEAWRVHGELAHTAGHGGGDLLEILDWVHAIRNGTPPRIGIHEAMDMTIPGLISQQSIAGHGRWLAVPDSREW